MKGLNIKYTAYVKESGENKYLEVEHFSIFQRFLNSLPTGKRMTGELKPYRKPRSLDQNAYWWGACYPILSDLTGHTIEEIHEICKKLFLTRPGVKINDTLWNKIPVSFRGRVGDREAHSTPSTTELSTSEGVEYTDSLRGLAEDLGGYIPTPKEAGYE